MNMRDLFTCSLRRAGWVEMLGIPYVGGNVEGNLGTWGPMNMYVFINIYILYFFGK